jgi:hypothetical protein
MQVEHGGALLPATTGTRSTSAEARAFADPRDSVGSGSSIRPQEAAELAADALGTLTHTVRHGGYQLPADVCAVLAELGILIRALPKALGQTAGWLETEHDAGRVTCDDTHNLTLTVHATVMGLHDATRNTEPLLRALDVAAQHAEHLIGRPR